MKNQRGVTLVALVVTIIVLIILAGISINLVLGNNGIITIAKKAKENTELARIEEEKELNELYDKINAEGSNLEDLPYDSIEKLTEFKTAIANAIEEAGGIKPEVSAETAVFANNIKGILKEVTKNATATAEDITKGKTAYVNGNLITGIKTENVLPDSITFTISTESAQPNIVAGKNYGYTYWTPLLAYYKYVTFTGTNGTRTECHSNLTTGTKYECSSLETVYTYFYTGYNQTGTAANGTITFSQN